MYNDPHMTLYTKILEYIDEAGSGPVRLLGIESGGVTLTERVFDYLRGEGLPDIGRFSVNVSRDQGKIRPRDKERMVREIKGYSPGFLEGAYLIALDDIGNDGGTKEIVDREVNEFIVPKFGIADYRFGVLFCDERLTEDPKIIYGTTFSTPMSHKLSKSRHLTPERVMQESQYKKSDKHIDVAGCCGPGELLDDSVLTLSSMHHEQESDMGRRGFFGDLMRKIGVAALGYSVLRRKS